MKFRLLRGLHSTGNGPDQVIYKPGDIIETDTDLVEKCNFPGSIKFERIQEFAPINEVPSEEEDDGFEKMTIKELQALAESNEIDLETAVKKGEIISVIRGAMDCV